MMTAVFYMKNESKAINKFYDWLSDYSRHRSAVIHLSKCDYRIPNDEDIIDIP